MNERAKRAAESYRELLDTFALEIERVLNDLDEDLRALMRGTPPPDILDRLHRGVEVLHGMSGVLEFQRTRSLARLGRRVLRRVEAGELELSPRIVRVLTWLSSSVRELFTDIFVSGRETGRRHVGLRMRLGLLAGRNDPSRDVPRRR